MTTKKDTKGASMRSKLFARSALGLLLTVSMVSCNKEKGMDSVKARQVEKIYFMIHPLLYRAPYAAKGEDPAAAERYQRYADYEKKISSRWFQAIGNMGPN